MSTTRKPVACPGPSAPARRTIKAPVVKRTCGTCRWWDADQAKNKTGKVQPDVAAPCLWPTPPLPASARDQRIASGPRNAMDRDDGKDCPCWTRASELMTIVHVNRHIIAANTKTGRNDPALTVKTYNSRVNAHEVQIVGNTHVVSRPKKPLPCGARVWIETDDPVKVLS